jgi:hypothetical protein
MLRNAATDLVTSAGQMNGTNMLGEILRQNLSSSGVSLEQDYTKWLHTNPPDSPHLLRPKIPPRSEKETRATMTAVPYTLHAAVAFMRPNSGNHPKSQPES